MKKFKRKNKVHTKYEDFYTTKDLQDPDKPTKINLTIEDFDAKGQVANPRAPCVVSTIDPNYVKDAALQKRNKKFRIKTTRYLINLVQLVIKKYNFESLMVQFKQVHFASLIHNRKMDKQQGEKDILRLREITRKKFIIFATKQSYLQMQRERAFEEHTYERIFDLQEFSTKSLCQMELSAFKELRMVQKNLLKLQQITLKEKLINTMSKHQRVLMEVQEVYARFVFLLKLIGYFDEIISPEDIKDNGEIRSEDLLSENIFSLDINGSNSVSKKYMSTIIAFMDNVVRPYLSKRSHLNADIWIKGYERTRHKIFNFNRRLTQVALLNHLVSIVEAKSSKTVARRIENPIMFMDPKCLTDRMEFLIKRSSVILDEFERCQNKDKLHAKIKSYVPVILKRIEATTTGCNTYQGTRHSDKQKKMEDKIQNGSTVELKKGQLSLETSTHLSDNQNNTTLCNVEKLQWHLLSLLQGLEMFEPQECRMIEMRVRKILELKKESSRRALVRQSRLQNWMDHFRKHDSQQHKNIN